MKDEKKTGFFKKIFGQKSSCCSLELEEIDSNEVKSSDARERTPSCVCGSTPNPEARKNEDKKKEFNLVEQ
jgi:hypothetical protein